MSSSTVVPATPRIGRAGLTAAGMAGVVVTMLLVGVLVTLLSTRSTLADQRDLTRVLLTRLDPTLSRAPGTLDQADPVLRDAAPVLKAARSSIPQLRRAGRDLGPVAAQLRAADLPSLFDTVRQLFTTAQPVIERLGPITRELGDSELPHLFGDVRSLTRTAERTLPEVAALAADARRRELPRRLSRTLPMIGSLNQLQKAALRTTRQTLTRTGRIEGLLQESLDVQNQLLIRATEIDRKIPGPTSP